LHGDCAYHAKALEEQAQAAGIACNVNQRGSKHRPLCKRQRARHRRLSRTRAIVEQEELGTDECAWRTCTVCDTA